VNLVVPRPAAAPPVVGIDLRFALSAPPSGRRSASLRSRPTTEMRTAVQPEKSTNHGKQKQGAKRQAKKKVHQASPRADVSVKVKARGPNRC
jgi:hypothetical protein